MKKQKRSSLLEPERKLTDKSLDTERGHSDTSYVNHSHKAELDTDKAVEKDRQRNDESRLRRRKEADQKSGPLAIAVEVSVLENRQLAELRQEEDTAIESQRSSIDAAMEREREVKHAQIEVLLNQRKDTDKNLLSERVKTDEEVDKSASLLKEEKAAHTGTKTELTTRDEFLAIVSHDLRNPVGAISSCAEMLLEDGESIGIGEKARTWVQLIKRNADLSLRLIGDVLDLERIANGKLELELAENNMKQIMTEAISGLDYIAKSKKINLSVLPSAESLNVLCDKDRVSQILSNLIGNALKFTPTGGAVTVKAETEKTEMIVSVQDTGPGIPPEKQKQVFDRYTQLKNKDREGLGLGLYISKSFTELHGGKISVSSSAGKGSTFSFTIPFSSRQSLDSFR